MPQVVVLGRLRETGEFAEIARHPEAEQIRGVLILRVDRIWFFANANGIRDHVKELIRQAPGPLHSVILNLAPVALIDVTASEVLAHSVGCILRVSGEVLAYQEIVTAAWVWLPYSAILELFAVTVFATNLFLTFMRNPVTPQSTIAQIRSPRAVVANTQDNQ